MINISKVIINKNYGSNLPIRKLSFKADTQDVFTKNEQATQELKRNQLKMDNEKLYNQNNKDFDINKMCGDLKARIIAFPFVLKGIMATIPTYFSKKIDADTFSQVYLERTPHLFARLDFGKDKETFAKDFENEIKMVKNVNMACCDYINGKMQKEELDETLEQNVSTYLETPENNEVFYLE